MGVAKGGGELWFCGSLISKLIARSSPAGGADRRGRLVDPIPGTIQKLGWVVLSCSTAIVIQHATEAALALDRSIAKG